MPQVSVIVPVYGVEMFMERCARSLFEQTLDDLEYLFIDDCTKDDSIGVLKRVLMEYPHRENQVHIHRMEHNSGQAAVREWGMKNACGEYVIHCDPDDWVDPNMYERMYEEAKKNDWDVVMCDFCYTDGENIQLKPEYLSPCLSDVVGDVITKKMFSSLCNKLCRRSLLESVCVYPKHDMGEDQVLLLQLLYGTKKCHRIPEPFYFRYLNPASITKQKSKKYCLKRFYDSVANAQLIEVFLSQHGMNGYEKELDRMKFYKRNNLLPLIGQDRVYRKLWADTYSEINWRVLFNNKVRLNDRVKYVLIWLGLWNLTNKILRRGE